MLELECSVCLLCCGEAGPWGDRLSEGVLKPAMSTPPPLAQALSLPDSGAEDGLQVHWQAQSILFGIGISDN
jgi:hypothetical protein